jgi:hypothetical protein
LSSLDFFFLPDDRQILSLLAASRKQKYKRKIIKIQIVADRIFDTNQKKKNLIRNQEGEKLYVRNKSSRSDQLKNE